MPPAVPVVPPPGSADRASTGVDPGRLAWTAAAPSDFLDDTELVAASASAPPCADAPAPQALRPPRQLAVSVAAQVAAQRREMATYGAEVLAIRRPALLPHRGRKGVLVLAADLDAVLRGLTAAMDGDDDAWGQRHAAFHCGQARQRPAGPEALSAAVDVACELLWRWLGAARGAIAIRAMRRAWQGLVTLPPRPWEESGGRAGPGTTLLDP